MIDCVESVNDNFTKLNVSGYDEKNKSSLGLDKVWFVNGSRDYFSKYEDSNFIGYEVYNSCGSYIVAVPK